MLPFLFLRLATTDRFDHGLGSAGGGATGAARSRSPRRTEQGEGAAVTEAVEVGGATAPQKTEIVDASEFPVGNSPVLDAVEEPALGEGEAMEEAAPGEASGTPTVVEVLQEVLQGGTGN